MAEGTGARALETIMVCLEEKKGFNEAVHVCIGWPVSDPKNVDPGDP